MFWRQVETVCEAEDPHTPLEVLQKEVFQPFHESWREDETLLTAYRGIDRLIGCATVLTEK
ncbi:MAG: hypothetical protein OXC30_05645 [Alphaproteobacteria bacterium]|nr:hypothetical protein [Alphaproteobacteria bacterium]